MGQPENYIQTVYKNDGFIAFVAGGVGGAVSRTVVSPVERVKILLQVQSSTTAYNGGLVHAVKQVYKEEGVKGLFRGNGINCLRIFPYSAVQYAVYEFCKTRVFHVGQSGHEQLRSWERLVGGALGGGASVLVTYPLDLVRTRLSIQTANLAKLHRSKAHDIRRPPGIVELLRRIFREEGGLRGWYRGVYPTSLGVVPFVALNFALYERLKALIPHDYDAGSVAAAKLAIGAVSGGIAQTVVYPFDLLRRRFQVLTMGQSELGFRYASVADALWTIGRQEGLRGYYKGLTANLVKVVPAMAVQWFVYELISENMHGL
ncbi:AGL047Cp [Eremothecium gossypii ATCC 10895]|uniref:AGL047Cp n=1 Tax=Eremothecium gossypii (strain ATCC 10895 / CBS 109.51 / FGSC 9923 / NRRL Y-1056) TaxID=284811 RepID=Q750J8_EREGS|nr:AGL047Cp [Eremothecium gossypii ATCC 10895]AAS54443.1 AGL047Cp [Eremothecium gossypii ATCC 10895]AEY98775.1 FAGL047Cp [Eremothecium gossypii FDAG1]